jgi:two-component system NarL family sensor kinase
MKYLLCLFITGLLVPVSYSQKLNVDSITKIIRESKTDTTRILSKRKLASYYLLHTGQDSEGFALLREARKEAEGISFQLGLCEVLMTEGNYYYRQSNWSEAISKFRELSDHSALISDTMNNLGGIYSSNGDYTTALEYYLKSRDVLEKMKIDSNAMSTVYVNIAGMYDQLNQLKKGGEYLAYCYPFLPGARPNLRYLYWQEMQNFADKNGDSAKVKSAIDSLERTLQTITLTKFQKNQYEQTLYEMKGEYESKYLKQYNNAIENYQEMLRLAKEMNDHPYTYNALCEIGNCYFLMNDFSSAIRFTEQAYQGAKTDSVGEMVKRSSYLLSQIYNSIHDKENAYKYLTVAYLFNDSLHTAKNLSQLNFLEASYQNVKKESEIAELGRANSEKQLKLVKRNRLLLITGISAITLLSILGLLYRNTRQKQIIAEKEQKIRDEQIRFLERQQQVVSLQSMINGQESERIRIAKDLHDGLGGLFSAVKMHFSTLPHEWPGIGDNLLYKKTSELISNASDELRKVAHNMMPEVLMKVGLVEALKDFCSNISSGKLLKVNFMTFGMEKRLGTSTEIMIYRIIQELINNIIKHAKATEAIVQFNREGDRLSIAIEDNGLGFDTQEAEEKRSMGLTTVKSRVNYLNGKLVIDSRKDVGTTVMIELLLNEN